MFGSALKTQAVARLNGIQRAFRIQGSNSSFSQVSLVTQVRFGFGFGGEWEEIVLFVRSFGFGSFGIVIIMDVSFLVPLPPPSG